MIPLPKDFRPFGWDCSNPDLGCFVQRCRPRFEVFKDCFPGKISLSDIDSTAEVNGYYLTIEFKLHRSALGTGQKLYLERLPPEFLALVAVCPDCRTMAITEIAIVENGKLLDWQPSSLECVRRLIRRWAQRALHQPPAWVMRRQNHPLIGKAA